MTTNAKKPAKAKPVTAKTAPAEAGAGADAASAARKPAKTTASKTPPAERRGSLAALAVNVPAITRAAIGSRGFAEAGLITHWAEIVGAELARGCQPDQLRFPRGKDGEGERRGGTLTLRCIGAMALELQHQTPLLLDRINSYFGYRAVAQLRLIQGSLRRRPQRNAAKLPPLAPADRAATEADLAALPESDVKDALRRLGDAIRQRSKLPKRR
ncbi:MAG TPA: DciA family protein [Dongiaceae bacterium]|nr:DciA family protein [Dongiaceae bacterium]